MQGYELGVSSANSYLHESSVVVISTYVFVNLIILSLMSGALNLI